MVTVPFPAVIVPDAFCWLMVSALAIEAVKAINPKNVRNTLLKSPTRLTFVPIFHLNLGDSYHPCGRLWGAFGGLLGGLLSHGTSLQARLLLSRLIIIAM